MKLNQQGRLQIYVAGSTRLLEVLGMLAGPELTAKELVVKAEIEKELVRRGVKL
ncbi:hypothetical protein [Acrocarpospora sp. B8E8]|uniref:hypothetical protein n=1 Tax=Acrocarpospora sp. B8E8 TaxID=3153572 RepID=UPI00325D6ED6